MWATCFGLQPQGLDPFALQTMIFRAGELLQRLVAACGRRRIPETVSMR
jgi:hypothetical protein